jgi:hypothetical protein
MNDNTVTLNHRAGLIASKPAPTTRGARSILVQPFTDARFRAQIPSSHFLNHLLNACSALWFGNCYFH